MLETKSWIKKISKYTFIIYIPKNLVLDSSFPFSREENNQNVLIKIEDDKLIIRKEVENGNNTKEE
ncbi:MAG: hypothetical protein QXG39_00275 [Candidatus Aenigmatarchaeota archaeon]